MLSLATFYSELAVVLKDFVNMYLLFLSILASLALANHPTMFNPQVLEDRQDQSIDPIEIPQIGSCPTGTTGCPGKWKGATVCIQESIGDVCCPQGCKLLLSANSKTPTDSIL